MNRIQLCFLSVLMLPACVGSTYEDVPRFEVLPGVAPGDACGPCDLGVWSAQGACSNPLGEEPASCDQVVFVDGDANVSGDGTQASPMTSIDGALALAEQNLGGGSVFLAVAGSSTHVVTSVVPGNVSISGGFSPAFAPDLTLRPELTGSDALEHAFGVRVEAEGARVRLHNLRVLAPEGLHTYALHVRQATPLELDHVDVVARKGGAGTPGETGNLGAPGGPGGDAGLAGVDVPGTGGANDACSIARGGSGGRGALVSSGGSRNADPGSSSLAGVLGGTPSMTGSSGDDGAPGVDGVQASPGSFSSGLYVPGTPATPGTSGTPGQGGGGGGGGLVESGERAAPGGGGGGAGGCPGAPGNPGMSGGASFGALLVASTLITQETTIQGAPGGEPGQGGAPGEPGEGGMGGAPGPMSQGVLAAGQGGRGGHAGASGRGGHGLRGPSWGLYCLDTVLEEVSKTTILAAPDAQHLDGSSSMTQQTNCEDF